MGQLTGGNFCTDLQAMLGNLITDSARLLRWVNFGYLDVTGGVDFDVLDEENSSTATVNNQNYVAIPSGAEVVRIVRNTTDDRLLDYVPLNEYWRLPQTAGVPTKWTRFKSNIMLTPKPNGVKSLYIAYKKSPTLLLAGSTTVIPDTWDAAILLLAGSHAFYALGQEARGAAIFARALNYIASRVTEEDLKSRFRGLEPSLPQAGG